ncbi:hypothetical protein KSK37_13365 [Kaistella sp. DKR-2]|uniref:hypothetical protein n=1 Tax=Kaistella soli TaxID=2849654 RepID=UPI001C27A712|nr:hypothetical protein [Kaistella soli]MBU8884077.1 hypothetical protein [Kaistella soli]
MSTNKTTNNVANAASQTLFRFTSLRNPQLTETKKENLGFIRRPEVEEMKGFFDRTLETWSASDGITRFSALVIAARNFVVAEDFSTEKKIIEKYQNLIDLGKTISRKETVTETILSNAAAEWSGNILHRKELWDHFIYQVVTQKDFYIKEAIGQVIKAIHYVEAADLTENEDNRKINGFDFRAKAASAVIVFPEALVLDPKPPVIKIPFTVDVSRISEDRIKYAELRDLSVMEQNQLSHLANTEVEVSKNILKKESLEKLKNELVQVQKDYNESCGRAYQEQYESYKADIQPELDRYAIEIKAVEDTFTDRLTDAEKEVAYQHVSMPDIPKFEFIYQNEIDLYHLQSVLTSDSFALFLELFTDYSNDLKASIYNNPAAEVIILVSSATLAEINDFPLRLNKLFAKFSTVLSRIDESISESFAKVLSTKEVSQKMYASVGGVLIPLVNPVKTVANTFYLQAVTKRMLFANNEAYVQFGFAVEDSSWSVSSMQITASTNTGTHQEMLHNIPVVDGKITPSPVFVNKFSTLSNLKIEIWFDNQCESILELANIVSDRDVSGVLVIDRPIADNGGVLNAAIAPTVFQPKHFGVKRLGIADYLKVEQSVHAYVPGEVSNIENVMASELRHKSSTSREYSEITDSTSKSQETEKMSDTAKTSRTDMQTEVARELDRQQSIEAHTSFSAEGGRWKFEVGGSYANNTAQHDSTRQAVAKSQEITERALERVLSKISEERVEKIIREYTETNVHEFDNRGKVMATTDGESAHPQHITGVYRWVDKKMKNQIYNYGKRTMFEFMIPEPSRLHQLATSSAKQTFTEPVDPRVTTMPSADVDEAVLRYWANMYGVQPTELPKENIEHHIPYEWFKLKRSQEQRFKELSIPENYAAKDVTVYFGYEYGYMLVSNFKGGDMALPYVGNGSIDSNYFVTGLNITEKFIFKYQGFGVDSFNVTFKFNCKLSDAFMLSWKKEQFNKIIAAYNVAKEKFDADVKAAAESAAAQEKDNKAKASIFYRNTEANVLKHNCIAYLLQTYNTLGKAMSVDDGTLMQSFSMKFGDDLDQYTALAKFMEQAFEWNVMDYTFYPYYWANKNHWQDLYLSEEIDPLFRSFLQAGMARVIVTVKPGFENAVQFFMTTGRIWNGGEVPVIGDPLYLSIVDELRQPTGEPQGKYWITRIPTTLTILQAKSVGLVVTDALPIFPEMDPENCENPLELETESAFGEPQDVIMQNTPGTTSTLA